MTTLQEIAYLVIRKLFKISLISVARSLDKVCGLSKLGGENKTGDLSVDFIDLLKNV